MAEINAKLVNDLRAKTGQGMMECKKMLTETGGDLEKAIEAFRKKGVKDSIVGRATTEGRVEVAQTATGAAAVELACNTDFTAKSEQLLDIAKKAAGLLAANPTLNVAEDATLKALLVNASQVTGENVQIGRSAVVTGSVGSYLYSTAGKGKIGVLLQFDKAAGDDVVKSLGMHIAAARPIALNRSDVPADIVAKEKEIAVEQAKQSGKPQNIAEKIAEGKLNSFYVEKVLLDQEFINAEVFKGSVGNMLKSKGLTLTKFVRLEVGQA